MVARVLAVQGGSADEVQLSGDQLHLTGSARLRQVGHRGVGLGRDVVAPHVHGGERLDQWFDGSSG